MPRAASSAFPTGGLLAGSLEGGCFWELQEGTSYQPHVLPMEAGNCTDIQVEPESRHCLVTYRPGEWRGAERSGDAQMGPCDAAAHRQQIHLLLAHSLHLGPCFVVWL